MSEQQFNQLYEEVKRLSTYGETSDGDDSSTSLYDWMSLGDCEGRSARSVANEWDELCEAAEVEAE